MQAVARWSSLCFIRLRSRGRLAVIVIIVTILLIMGISSTQRQNRAPMSKPWIMTPCHSNSEALSIQRALLLDNTAKCNNAGVCFCDQGKYFDGRKCLDLAGSRWNDMFSTLRDKWKEVPFQREVYTDADVETQTVGDSKAQGRAHSSLLLRDNDMLRKWEDVTTTDTFTMYYASVFRGRRIIDIGSGLARQTLQFAIHGAHVTFVDIVKDNLEVIRRVAKSKGCDDRVKTIYIESIVDMERALEGKVFDAVCAFGSMHHAPREFIQKQVRVLRDHLAPGGLWVQLAYPINRFRNPRPADNLPDMQAQFYGDGISFNNGGWGGDNDKTPWAEWYEPGKVMYNLGNSNSGENVADDYPLSPTALALNDPTHPMRMNWCGIINADEFIWFQLTKV